jgi:hypothetical protein
MLAVDVFPTKSAVRNALELLPGDVPIILRTRSANRSQAKGWRQPDTVVSISISSLLAKSAA